MNKFILHMNLRITRYNKNPRKQRVGGYIGIALSVRPYFSKAQLS